MLCFFFRQFVKYWQKYLKVVPIYSLCRVLGNSMPRVCFHSCI